MMKDQVETEAAVKLEGKDNIVQWLVRWGAMVPSRFLVGKDGKTPFETHRPTLQHPNREVWGESMVQRLKKEVRTISQTRITMERRIVVRPCQKLQRDLDRDSRGSS